MMGMVTGELQCCGIWTEYPTPGHDTECPACHTRFTISASGSTDSVLTERSS